MEQQVNFLLYRRELNYKIDNIVVLNEMVQRIFEAAMTDFTEQLLPLACKAI